MTVNVISALDIAPQPWRNGGGATRELLAWPNAQAWQVRISLADIDRDGAFSRFVGVQRWFGVVQGAGVVLDFEGKQVVQTVDSAALQFDGALEPHCNLKSGATRDINLMVKSIHAKLGAMDCVVNGQYWNNTMALRGLLVASAGVWSDGVQNRRLQAFDFLWSLNAGAAPWRFDADTNWAAHNAGKAAGSWWLGADLHACKELA